MRVLTALLALALLAACRGEPVPRDYQNTPTNTRSTDDRADAPMPESSTATPEPDATAEGTSAPYERTGPATTEPPGKDLQRVPPEPEPPPQ